MGYGKITAKQQQILDYIKDEILKRGYPPTVREIGETVNLKSTSSVHSHLETLEKNGYIRRDPTKPVLLKYVTTVSRLFEPKWLAYLLLEMLLQASPF